MPRLRANLRQLSASARRRFALDVTAHPDWLRVLVEGDSWFAFPGIAGRRNVISHLMVTFDARFALYRIDEAGDTMADMLTGSSRDRLRRLLDNDRYDFQLLLFSGGGNDLIDDIGSILRSHSAGWLPRHFIDHEALRGRLDGLDELWVDLVELRDRYRPGCVIVTHTYDYGRPDGRAVHALGKSVAGPWLRQPMEEKGIPRIFRPSVIRRVMRAYRRRLQMLADTTPGLVVVNTQGTLSRGDWDDEIHPSSQGFRRIAGRLAGELGRLYPGMIA